MFFFVMYKLAVKPVDARQPSANKLHFMLALASHELASPRSLALGRELAHASFFPFVIDQHTVLPGS
jgi:hypothetical protein